MPVREVGWEPHMACPPSPHLWHCGDTGLQPPLLLESPSRPPCRSCPRHRSHGALPRGQRQYVGRGVGRGAGGWQQTGEPRPFQNTHSPGRAVPSELSPKPRPAAGGGVAPLPRAQRGVGSRTLTGTPLGAARPLLVLRALAGSSPEERTGADSFSSLGAAPARHTAAAP